MKERRKYTYPGASLARFRWLFGRNPAGANERKQRLEAAVAAGKVRVYTPAERAALELELKKRA